MQLVRQIKVYFVSFDITWPTAILQASRMGPSMSLLWKTAFIISCIDKHIWADKYLTGMGNKMHSGIGSLVKHWHRGITTWCKSFFTSKRTTDHFLQPLRGHKRHHLVEEVWELCCGLPTDQHLLLLETSLRDRDLEAQGLVPNKPLTSQNAIHGALSEDVPCCLCRFYQVWVRETIQCGIAILFTSPIPCQCELHEPLKRHWLKKDTSRLWLKLYQ